MTDTPFDFETALKALQSGQPLTGKEGILTPLIKQLTVFIERLASKKYLLWLPYDFRPVFK